MDTISERIAQLTGSVAPNQDQETGIHYGVIPCRDLNQDALEDIYTSGTDLDYQEAQEDMKQAVSSLVSRIMADEELQTRRETLDRTQGDSQEAVLEAVLCRISQMAEEALSEALGSFDTDSLSDTILTALEAQATAESLSESLWSEIETEWSESYSMGGGEPSSYLYEEDGYRLQLCRDGDIFVLKSPYVTLCRECSPCAPNAGYLTSQGGGVTSYALGSEWFEGNRLPYRLFAVGSGLPVVPVSSYRLSALQRPGESRYVPLSALEPLFLPVHSTEEDANRYAALCGFSSWYVSTENQDQEVTEAQANEYHGRQDQDEDQN